MNNAFAITAKIASVIIGINFTVQSYFIYKHFFPTEPITVAPVQNKVQIGNLAGNRNLEFGVKNILEEYLVVKEYDLADGSDKVLKVEILYMDVFKREANLSIFHGATDAVIIRMRGTLYYKGKVVSKAIVEEQAEEVSMSTLLIDEGGQFNQQNLSSALKKSCNSLINKLL
jgi:hypothetical protein